MSESLKEGDISTLGLCINNTWTTKQKGEGDSGGACNISTIDNEVSRLFEAREKFLGRHQYVLRS
jgi:hypothetical protein